MLMTAVSFTAGCKPEDNPNNGGDNDNHEYVDLGLPSGTLWATCNVGAETPEGYGNYYAWGETSIKTVYEANNYKYFQGEDCLLTKYCNDVEEGFQGYSDTLTVLLAEDDAATANWGTTWRMPSEQEFEELYQNTTHMWVVQNGVNGRVFTAANGNSIFLPVAGAFWGSHGLVAVGEIGLYWSSSLDIEHDPYVARALYLDSDYCEMEEGDAGRCYGLSIRPVRSAR